MRPPRPFLFPVDDDALPDKERGGCANLDPTSADDPRNLTINSNFRQRCLPNREIPAAIPALLEMGRERRRMKLTLARGGVFVEANGR